jgi:hypothetical protein
MDGMNSSPVQWLPLVVQPPLDVSNALHRAARVPDVRDVPLADLADPGAKFNSSI